MDRVKQYFTEDTDFGDLHKAVFHDHNSENLLGVGIDFHLKERWIEFLLLTRITGPNEFIYDELKLGRAYSSTGTGGHLAQIKEGGEILTWPIAEVSIITPYAKDKANRSNPADWRTNAWIATEWKGKPIELAT